MLSQLGKASPAKSFFSGRYNVHEVLGEGAIGTVYKVSDRELDGEVVALKVLHPHLVSDEKILSRFREQVVLNRQLSHKNIIQLYDFDKDRGDTSFITMEYVEGRSLRDFLQECRQKKLPADELLILLTELAQGLAYAHSRGIVHRDLKPSNILVSYSGNIKIADFGLAKSLESSQGLTQTGEIVGSPFYMAPEQFRGDVVDARADVYSFGILSYELLFGQLPFEEQGYMAQARAHLQRPLKLKEEDTTPDWYPEFLNRCCDKNAEHRFVSGVELLQFLRGKNQTEIRPEEAVCYTFLRESPRKKSQRQVKRVFVFLWLFAVSMLIISARQTNTRIFMGTFLLKTEKALGVDLWPLKSIFFIQASILRPEEMLFRVAQEDPGCINIESFLAAGGQRDMADPEGNTLVHYAVSNSDTNIIGALNRYNLELNQQNKKGETPLLRAVRRQLPWSTLKLIQLRANPNICDFNKNCPFHIVYQQHDMDEINLFLKSGAQSSIKDRSQDSVLHLAVKDLNWEVFGLMVYYAKSNGDEVNVRDSLGRTPLSVAVLTQGETELKQRVMQGLVSLGADLQARDNLGHTALFYALRNRDEAMVKTLLKYGSDPKESYLDGSSAKEMAQRLGFSHLSSAWTN